MADCPTNKELLCYDHETRVQIPWTAIDTGDSFPYQTVYPGLGMMTSYSIVTTETGKSTQGQDAAPMTQISNPCYHLSTTPLLVTGQQSTVSDAPEGPGFHVVTNPLVQMTEVGGELAISPLDYMNIGYPDVDIHFVQLYLGTKTQDESQEKGLPHTPPDTNDLDPSLVDSGYNETAHLQCLETVLDWKITSPCSTPLYDNPVDFYLTSPTFQALDHRGFEDYIDDIYYHRLGIEYKYQPNKCLDDQHEVTPSMRGLLVNWMTGIHHQLSMCQDTLFIAVNIVDRFLDVMNASRDYLQLLGVTTLLIAAKCEEITPPEITELLGCCSDTYTRDQMTRLEKLILNIIKFDLMVPTSQFFLEYFASYCIGIFNGIQCDLLRQARALARCILELSLQDYELSQLRPSMLAFCVWKVAIDDSDCNDGDYVPNGLQFTRTEFEKIYREVRVFSNNLKHSFPDVSSICEHYFNLYGVE